MNIVWTILIGLVAGAVAKFIMPGKDPGGIIITILIGIAGSFIFTVLRKISGNISGRRSCRFYWCSNWRHHSSGSLQNVQEKVEKFCTFFLLYKLLLLLTKKTTLIGIHLKEKNEQ
ncbi:MAG: GlsB/YeaQ/YmgE family stress response membrane protein [Ignavibacteriaceae bacterium]|nr:GlsB/YeaQ/YmgE family stress response membrane protein [Ignavibacteriaceae bacterium]